MTKTGTFLAGAFIGGIIGYLVGDLIAYHFAPEYYDPEELDEWSEIVDSYTTVPDEAEDKSNEEAGKKRMGKKHDYTKHFAADPNPSLEKLVAKYNRDPKDDMDEEADLQEPYLEAIESELSEHLDQLNIEDDPEGYLDGRDKEQTYIMTKEEWDAQETDNVRVTLVYYSEDDVLTDENNRALPSVEKLIGADALSNFGTFSDDDHVVYVCNPRTGAEYEVVLHEGAYSDTLVVAKPRRKKATPAKKGLVKNVFDEAAEEEDE